MGEQRDHVVTSKGGKCTNKTLVLYKKEAYMARNKRISTGSGLGGQGRRRLQNTNTHFNKRVIGHTKMYAGRLETQLRRRSWRSSMKSMNTYQESPARSQRVSLIHLKLSLGMVQRTVQKKAKEMSKTCQT